MPEDHNGRPEARGLAGEVKRLIAQTNRLAGLELELARAELGGKVGLLGRGVGLMIAAAVFGFLALCVLTAAAVLAIATAVAGWLAAVIVFGVYILLAGLVGLLGVAALKRATPLAPTLAITSLKGDVKWVETQVKSAGT